jgi:hypothetical protein
MILSVIVVGLTGIDRWSIEAIIFFMVVFNFILYLSDLKFHGNNLLLQQIYFFFIFII